MKCLKQDILCARTCVCVFSRVRVTNGCLFNCVLLLQGTVCPAVSWAALAAVRTILRGSRWAAVPRGTPKIGKRGKAPRCWSCSKTTKNDFSMPWWMGMTETCAPSRIPRSQLWFTWALPSLKSSTWWVNFSL